MNKRLEEKLAMLAFGDLSPEETMHLEQEVAGDREAMRILEDYRGMRSGLKAMAAIPEHQLSTERLRHTILNQGLKPKAAQRQLGWLWMPTMAAALTFGFVMLRHARNPGIAIPPLAMNTTSGSDRVAINFPKSDPFAGGDASAEILSVAQPEPARSPVREAMLSSRHRRNDRGRIEFLTAGILSQFAEQPLPENSPMALTHPSGSAAFDSSSGAPIVLIDSAKDQSTGAQKATEVDSTSHVIVGG